MVLGLKNLIHFIFKNNTLYESVTYTRPIYSSKYDSKFILESYFAILINVKTRRSKIILQAKVLIL